MSVRTIVQPFGEVAGKTVNKYTITEQSGIQVSIINYGAIITELIVPDKKGAPVDVVLGFSTLDGYLNAPDIYMGAVCGRYAGRISKGRFRINGDVYQLKSNNHVHTLHGGSKGFDKVIWEGEILKEGNGIELNYFSKDGEEGFPGNLKTKVVYKVENNSLLIEYYATTDKPTPVNLTNHSYFNLTGNRAATIFNHQLQLQAKSVLETKDDLIPTGGLVAVENSWLDYSSMQSLLKGFENGGYDHCYVIDKPDGSMIQAAVLKSSETGIVMNIHTTKPGVQLYTGNYLHDQLIDTKNNVPYSKYAGLCLETQSFPDSPNHKEFPNTILKPGEEYHEHTIYEFTIKN